MAPLIDFTFFIVSAILSAIVLVVLVWAIVSWLVLFDVLNMRNRQARYFVDLLDRIVLPLLRPLRRVIPNLGGLDITPFLLILVITGAQQYLLPALHYWLLSLVAPPLPGA